MTTIFIAATSLATLPDTAFTQHGGHGGGPGATRVTLVVRRAAVMAMLAPGIVASLVVGTELGPAGTAEGMAALDGMVPAGTGDFLMVGSLVQLPPPIRIHINTFTTVLTTTLITILITGFHTLTTRAHPST